MYLRIISRYHVLWILCAGPWRRNSSVSIHFILSCACCVLITDDSWDDRKLQTAELFPVHKVDLQQSGCIIADLAYCGPHCQLKILHLGQNTIKSERKLSLCWASWPNQWSEQSQQKQLKPWALIKLAGCTNTRPVSLFPSSVGGWKLQIK